MAVRVFADSRRLTEFMSVPIRVPGEQAVREGRALAHRILAPAEAAWRRSDANTVPGRLREAGLPLSATRSVLGMIVVASVETTASAVPRLLALLSDLELWDAVSSSPLPLERWVDEGLRYLAPLPAVTRSVRIHRSLRGRRLKAGKPVLVVLRSALRDPRVIDRPEDFDPGRPIPSILRNLWFGAGAHYCVGGPVTTTQLCDIVGALAREVGPLEVLDRSPAIRTLLPHYASLRLRRRTGRDAALVTGART
jgi:cytochrome P450